MPDTDELGAGASRPEPETEEMPAPAAPVHFIDVYVVSQVVEPGTPIGEASSRARLLEALHALLEEQDEEQEGQQGHEEVLAEAATPSGSGQRAPGRWLVPVLLVLLVVLLGGASGAVLLPAWQPSATITLLTQAQTVTTRASVQVVTNGQAEPGRDELAGQALPTLTISQQQRVAASGTVHQAAQAAHGNVTLYNAAPFAQTVPAATLLVGADGVEVVTEQEAEIPAAVPPMEGAVTVAAQAVTPGAAGNIRADDLSGPCCRLNVFVSNTAFTGGQEARTYQVVRAQDIEAAVRELSARLGQSVQAALQSEVAGAETLVRPVFCQQQSRADQQPGAAAATVTVTVEDRCTGVSYSTQVFDRLTRQLARADAAGHLGTGYVLTGLQSSISGVRAREDGMEMQVRIVSTWVAMFTQGEQQAMKEKIAGMSKEQATATLMQLRGVQRVSVSLQHTSTVPTNVQDIHLLWIQL